MREGSSILQSHKASGEMSPKVLRSAALYALNAEGVSGPYSECESMVSCIANNQIYWLSGPKLETTYVEVMMNDAARSWGATVRAEIERMRGFLSTHS